MIKYIGSKRALLQYITGIVRCLVPSRGVILDLFSGTARVGHALKKHGYFVIANDYLFFATTLATCYVQADRHRWLSEARDLLQHLSQLPPREGFVTQTYCIKARYFHPKNGMRIDAIREEIARLRLHPELEAIAVTALIEAADRVDSTVGVQMAYLKEWAPRALNDLELRVPDLVVGSGLAHCGDALDAIEMFEADLVYIDPPYNQHSYLGNYHVWETIARWDNPEVYGVACKRFDCKLRKSVFNSRKKIRGALQRLVERARARWLVVSFSDEGFLTAEEMIKLLRERGHVRMVRVPYRRYVGAKIGIYNPNGEKVGQVSHTTNHEFLFVVGPDRRLLEKALEQTRTAGQVSLF